MKQPNFITILKTLKQKELSAFQQFIHATLPADCIPIVVFEYLINGNLNTQLEQLREKKVLDKIFQDNRNPTKSLSNTFSDLLRSLEEFLLIQKLKEKKHDMLRHQWLTEIYQEKKQGNLFQKSLNKVIEKLEKKNPKDENDFLQALLLYEFRFFNTLTHDINPDEDLKNCMKYLDRFFTAKKMKFAAEMRNRENVIKIHYDFPFKEEAKAYFTKDGFSDSPVSTLFFLALKMLEEGSHESFQIFKKAFLKYQNQIAPEHQHIFLSYLLNFTNLAVRNGHSYYLSENFEWNKKGVEKGIFIADGYFSYVQFINIVQSGSKNKAFQWTENFINTWKKRLPPSEKEPTLLLCQAIIHFEKRAFDKTLEILTLFNHSNVFLNILLKVLQIQTFYEQGKLENQKLISDYCRALEAYLGRNSTSNSDFIQSCKNFIRLVRQLIKVNANIKKQKIQEALDNADKISFKIWLQEKIDAL